MNDLRTDAINVSLVKTLSSSRLKKYLESCNADLHVALGSYERNTRLSEAFYTPLQCVEICLRNTIHQRMSDLYGSDWMTNEAPPLSGMSKSMVKQALEELQKNSDWPSNDAIVSELKFAFWVGLLGPGYDGTLWRKTLHVGFALGGGKKRKTVHARFNLIRRFRNRVAHHEPIFQKDLIAVHKEIIEAIAWMCADTAAWATHVSRLPSVHADA
ncbi:hypothetical protein [Allomesorhizobium camelthorni]|uniref:Abi family protein n=1 Tax=Allomesorhizobium camelthorni TaxID=475069 RepID=A0A6G4WJH0_9HYPH|nr:hypothetical protein [Mesorhizobium camelthorni]NGO54508.1 hypothetical protein [Mesorhizobium camelthorni]